MSEQKEFSTALASATSRFLPMIEKQLTVNGVNFTGYERQCAINALAAIHTAMDAKGINWADRTLDHSNIQHILLNVSSLKLNAAASPREVYFQIRNVSVKVGNETIWKKKIEMGIEGDGNDAILSNFGRDVKKVCPYWLVREKDDFTYPKYRGVDIEPPQWSPTGQGEVVRIVYPIIKNDGTIDYYIGERADVAKNLLAHINNNIMNETFGVCADRFKATADEKKKINEKKRAVLKKAKDLGLDALDDPELQDFISPAWTEYQSREQMIIRKIRNNIVKKIPKNFGNAYIEMTYHQQGDEGQVTAEIAANANNEPIDIQSEIVPENDPHPESEPPKQEVKPEPQPAAQTLKPTGSSGPNF